MGKKRWEKESQEFVDTLIDGVVNPLNKKEQKTRTETTKQRALRIRQTTSGGRPSSGTTTDPLVPYNFKLHRSELEAVKTLALERTMTIRELMGEAVNDLLTKYNGRPAETQK